MLFEADFEAPHISQVRAFGRFSKVHAEHSHGIFNPLSGIADAFDFPSPNGLFAAEELLEAARAARFLAFSKIAFCCASCSEVSKILNGGALRNAELLAAADAADAAA